LLVVSGSLPEMHKAKPPNISKVNVTLFIRRLESFMICPFALSENGFGHLLFPEPVVIGLAGSSEPTVAGWNSSADRITRKSSYPCRTAVNGVPGQVESATGGGLPYRRGVCVTTSTRRRDRGQKRRRDT